MGRAGARAAVPVRPGVSFSDLLTWRKEVFHENDFVDGLSRARSQYITPSAGCRLSTVPSSSHRRSRTSHTHTMASHEVDELQWRTHRLLADIVQMKDDGMETDELLEETRLLLTGLVTSPKHLVSQETAERDLSAAFDDAFPKPIRALADSAFNGAFDDAFPRPAAVKAPLIVPSVLLLTPSSSGLSAHHEDEKPASSDAVTATQSPDAPSPYSRASTQEQLLDENERLRAEIASLRQSTPTTSEMVSPAKEVARTDNTGLAAAAVATNHHDGDAWGAIAAFAVPAGDSLLTSTPRQSGDNLLTASPRQSAPAGLARSDTLDQALETFEPPVAADAEAGAPRPLPSMTRSDSSFLSLSDSEGPSSRQAGSPFLSMEVDVFATIDGEVTSAAPTAAPTAGDDFATAARESTPAAPPGRDAFDAAFSVPVSNAGVLGVASAAVFDSTPSDAFGTVAEDAFGVPSDNVFGVAAVDAFGSSSAPQAVDGYAFGAQPTATSSQPFGGTSGVSTAVDVIAASSAFLYAAASHTATFVGRDGATSALETPAGNAPGGTDASAAATEPGVWRGPSYFGAADDLRTPDAFDGAHETFGDVDFGGTGEFGDADDAFGGTDDAFGGADDAFGGADDAFGDADFGTTGVADGSFGDADFGESLGFGDEVGHTDAATANGPSASDLVADSINSPVGAMWRMSSDSERTIERSAAAFASRRAFADEADAPYVLSRAPSSPRAITALDAAYEIIAMQQAVASAVERVVAASHKAQSLERDGLEGGLSAATAAEEQVATANAALLGRMAEALSDDDDDDDDDDYGKVGVAGSTMGASLGAKRDALEATFEIASMQQAVHRAVMAVTSASALRAQPIEMDAARNAGASARTAAELAEAAPTCNEHFAAPHSAPTVGGAMPDFETPRAIDDQVAVKQPPPAASLAAATPTTEEVARVRSRQGRELSQVIATSGGAGTGSLRERVRSMGRESSTRPNPFFS